MDNITNKKDEPNINGSTNTDPNDFAQSLSDIDLAGGPILLPNDGRIGVTMFDTGSSKDSNGI